MAVWLAGCAASLPPGPVSISMLRRLEANTIPTADLKKRVAAGEIRFSAAPPPVNTLRVPMKTDGHTIKVTCGINGKNVPLLLDTGASHSLLNAEVAIRHQVSLLHADEYKVKMIGVVGEEQGRVGLLSPLQLGEWGLQSYPCIIRTQQDGYGAGYGPSLLGFDLPLRFCSYLTIDFRSSELVFGFRQPVQKTKSARCDSMPFTLSHGTPMVRLRSGNVTWEATVDTGSFNGIEISKEVAQRLGIADAGRAVKGMTVGGIGGLARAEDLGMRVVTVPHINVGGMDFTGAQIDIAPGSPRIGCFFLKDYRVTFDFRRQLMWLEW